MTRCRFPPAPTSASALVLTAHPSRDSFNNALAQAWSEGALERGLRVQSIHVADLTFDPCLRADFGKDQPLEPDLERVTQAIADAAHFVIAFPLWWASVLLGWRTGVGDAFSIVGVRPSAGGGYLARSVQHPAYVQRCTHVRRSTARPGARPPG